jgi:hypothetical protein
MITPTYLSPLTRSKGIVWRAAPKTCLGERLVRIEILRIFAVNGLCGSTELELKKWLHNKKNTLS